MDRAIERNMATLAGDAMYALQALCEELNASNPERNATVRDCINMARDMRERVTAEAK